MEVNVNSSNFDNCDILEYLQGTPNSNIALKVKCDMKDKRPTPFLKIKTSSASSSKGKNKSLVHNRTFQLKWYERYPWLAGSAATNKMFCYRCLLFGSKEGEWCKGGISDLNNFIQKAMKHQKSKTHLLNDERYFLLGSTPINHVLSEAARLQATQHNEQVKANREVLARITQAMMFLCKNELALREHQEDENSCNKGNFLSLLGLLAQNESIMRDHLSSSSLFKRTSPEIQNELIEVITAAVNEKISSEIKQSSFVSIQADETLDVSCKSQLSIIIRYCLEGKIQERFIGFYDVSDNKCAVALSRTIIDALKSWNISGEKVVSQTYDGAAMMAGSAENDVQNLIKLEYCPQAIFLHCYEHQLNLVILHGAKHIKKVKLFIGDLMSFHSFFSKSSKRTLLIEKGFQLPQAIATQWNFHSRAVSTIHKFYLDLQEVFDFIIQDSDGEWDSASISFAHELKRTLDDPTFVFLLFVFQACFVHFDNLFPVLQSIISTITFCQSEVNLAIIAIEELRNESFVKQCFKKCMELNPSISFLPKDEHELKVLMFEILDTVSAQMIRRFCDLKKLSFLELLNEKNFHQLQKCPQFVKEKIVTLIKQYPVFDSEKLENELSNIYFDVNKHIPPHQLISYLHCSGLNAVYSEVYKLLELILTLPATSANCERSTLKRIKTHLRNAMTNERLSNFTTLAIEKELIGKLSDDTEFISRVIDIFANKKERRTELIYKVV